MSTTITVHITKDVLEKTKMCASEERTKNCAISYAVRELFPKALTCCEDIYFDENLLIEAPLPTNAIAFISWFDEATPEERVQMSEIAFDIEIPDEALAHIDISEVYRILKESKTLSLVQ